MRIPFVDSDIEDLITILDDDGTEVRSFFDGDDDDEFDDEFGVKIEEEDLYSHEFDTDEEEEPTYQYDDDFGDDYTNTITSSTKLVPAPVRVNHPAPKGFEKFLDFTNTMTSSANVVPFPAPVNHSAPMGFKKFLPKIAYAIAFCIGLLSVLWFWYTKAIVTPQINVEMASVYPLQFTSVSNPLNVTVAYNVTAGWNINFAVTNPSKEHVLSYSNLVATVYYKGNPAWVTMVPAFYQEEYSVDFVHAIFDRNPIRVDNSFAVSVLKDISYGSASEFSVRLSGNIRQKMASDAQKKHSGGHALLVLCGLDVEFLPKAGLMAVATPKKCSTSVGW